MQNTSNAGNAEQNGLPRLNPRQIAVKLIPVAGGSPVTVLDATDEQFEAFVKQVGVPVAGGAEGQRWSFDNKCRLINYARKYRLHLPFVDVAGIKNNSPDEHSDEHPLEPAIAPVVVGQRQYPDLEGE